MYLCLGGGRLVIVPSLQDNIPFMMTVKLSGYLELVETSLKNFPQSALILGSFSDFWTSTKFPASTSEGQILHLENIACRFS